MSGLKFCVGAAAVLCAAAAWSAKAEPAPVGPVTIPYPSLDVAVEPEMPVAPPADSIPAAVPPQPAAIPLPAGVYVGLFGLASAAIARRRYLKRR